MLRAPLRLRCEFVNNPLGVTAANPRLSWWVHDQRPAEIQSAYEIIAASTPILLQQDVGDLWLSGRVDAAHSAHVTYAGAELVCSQRVWWKVRTFDSDGLGSPWSEPAFFETGLTSEEDWQGHWIGSPLQGSRSRGVPVVAMRREFYLGAQVQHATLYVAALGDYKLGVNGADVGAVNSGAVWCDYQHECYYQTYDLTEHVTAGNNALGVLLADGYYAGYLPGFGRSVYGQQPGIRLFLKIDLDDGQQLSIASDHSWRWYPSWVLAADINAGEHIDFGQFLDAWRAPGFNDDHWSSVQVLAPFTGTLRSQLYPALNITQVLRPQTLPALPRTPGRQQLEYDFGCEVVGRVRVDLRCLAADDVQVHYSLDDSFSHATADTFTTVSAGDAEDGRGQICESAFALHSFRYARVMFTSGASEIEDLFALRIAYPEQPALKLRSDHPTLNELINVLNNSVSGVALSVPMRGVQTSERLPHAAYAATWVPMVAQQQRAHALVSKWLSDMALANRLQEPVQPYVPAVRGVDRRILLDGDAVAHFETFVQVLWALYRHQDDQQSLARYYPEVRAGALACRYQNPTLLRQQVDANLYGEGLDASLVATCSLHGALKIAARMAGVLGHLTDHEMLESLAADVRKAFRQRFLSGDGHLLGESQSVFVAALYNDMLDVPERPLAEQSLLTLLQDNNYHAQVVPAVLRALLPTLSTAGRLDVAYMVLLQTSQPSWFGNINAGGTLVARQPGMFDIAEIGLLEWLVESMVGIALDSDYSVDQNAYRGVRIQPMPPFGKQFLAGSPIRLVEASLSTLQGVYEVKWQIKESCFELDVLVPPSCTAVVVMPDGIEHAVRSGAHSFVMDFGAGGDGVPTLLDMNVG